MKRRDLADDEEGNAHRLAETLRKMTRRSRAHMLRMFVSSLDSSDAHYLLELVKRKLSCDPLSELPVELQLRVLLHMEDPLSLLRMASVCRRWRQRVLSDTCLWQQKMEQTYLSVPARKLVGPRVVDCITALRWETMLARNWQGGNCTWRVTVAAHGASVITCLQLDEANGRLISGADNGTVAVWDLATASCLMLLSGHQGGVWALKAISHNGPAGLTDLLVTGSTDRTLIVWNLKTGQRLFDLIGHSSTVRCVEFVNGLIVSGSRDGTLRVWDPADGRCLHILTGHTASVRCITAFRDHHVVSGSYDHSLRVWDPMRGTCVAVCAGHDGKVYSVAASSDYIFSGGIDAKIKVWRPQSGRCVDVFCEHSALVGLLEVHDGTLVAGSTDGSLSLWNAKTLTRIRHVELAHHSSITALGLNRYSIISGSERALRMWSVPELRSDEPVESQTLSDKTDVVWRIAMGETVAVIAYQQAGITRMDILNYSPL